VNVLIKQKAAHSRVEQLDLLRQKLLDLVDRFTLTKDVDERRWLIRSAQVVATEAKCRFEQYRSDVAERGNELDGRKAIDEGMTKEPDGNDDTRSGRLRHSTVRVVSSPAKSQSVLSSKSGSGRPTMRGTVGAIRKCTASGPSPR
jgi:hypothetical protein